MPSAIQTKINSEAQIIFSSYYKYVEMFIINHFIIFWQNLNLP